MKNKVLVEVSGRHVHLCQEHIDKLFGKNYKLTKIKDLSQPGEYAAEERVDLINGSRVIENVRVLGPPREESQVEMSITDSFELGLKAPLRLSGDLGGSEDIVLKGPKGRVNLKRGAIVAERHLHLSPEQAKEFAVKNNQEVSIKIGGERSVTFHNVFIRIGDYDAALHLDTDEGNAAGIEGKTYGELIK